MSIKTDLDSLADPERAKKCMSYFQTGKGGYGEGDRFLGIKVPDQRVLAKKYYRELGIGEIFDLLQSEIHEYRLTALLMLVYRFPKASVAEREEIFNLYLENTAWINNWDLVDSSAPQIVGCYLFARPERRGLLEKLARSESLWERRIAVLATFHFIAEGDFGDFLKLAELLLADKHDLIHKAVGWGLREVGKKDLEVEEAFLDEHCREMPRTMLRYAIEKFEEKKRRGYMEGARVYIS